MTDAEKTQEHTTRTLHSLDFAVDNLIRSIRTASPLERIILQQALSKTREARSLVSDIDCALNLGEPSATNFRPPVG
jgi:hypothetical protein